MFRVPDRDFENGAGRKKEPGLFQESVRFVDHREELFLHVDEKDLARVCLEEKRSQWV